MQAPVKIVNENVLDVQCIYTADGTLGVNPSECDETDGFSSKLKVFDRFGGTMLFMSTKKCTSHDISRQPSQYSASQAGFSSANRRDDI